MSEKMLRLHSYESFGAVDGPGIRLVVFLQGCPLRCIFCHNPDTWDPQGGVSVTKEEIVKRARRMRPYLGAEGGVTFSGGEPLLQAAALIPVIHALHDEGFHVAIDTSGAIDTPEARQALDLADLILLDVKSPFPDRFKEITGLDFIATKQIFDYLKEIRKPVWIRQVVAHGLNHTDAEKDATKSLIHGLNVQRIDRLPYHELGLHKYESLGIPYRGSMLSVPTQEELSL